MTDENKAPETPPQAQDMQVVLAQFEQRMADREAAFKKDMEVQANQIHSSYSKKLKKLGLEDKVADGAEEDDSPNRKPTKKEMELTQTLEKMLKKTEEAELRAKQAQDKQA